MLSKLTQIEIYFMLLFKKFKNNSMNELRDRNVENNGEQLFSHKQEV